MRHTRATERRREAWGLALMILVAAGCSTPNTTSADDTLSSADGSASLTEEQQALLATAAETASTCDILDPTRCLLPFPSSHFLSFDESTPTGRRVAFASESMPKNADGTAVDPTDWNRSDGFSPMSPMLAYFNRIDLGASNLVGQGEIESSLADDSTSMLIDLTDGIRLPHWVEIDQQTDDPAQRLTIMRPAVAMPEGHHIAVVYRHLVDDRQRTIQPTPSFLAIRDRLDASSSTAQRALDDRAIEIDALLESLTEFGVQRFEVTLAWDFWVASAESTTGPLLAMRDDMFKRFALASPTYGVDEVIEDPAQLPDGIGRIVRGIVQVPSYLDGDGGVGTGAVRDANGLPKWSGKTLDMPFSCMLTKRQLGRVSGAVEPALPVVYGHGLLGSHREVERGDLAKSAADQNFMHCATDWLGMSENDIQGAIAALTDLSKFGAVVDRMMQGIVGQLALARVLRHPNGFSKHPAFQPCNGPPNAFCPFPPVSTYDVDEVFYDGNSQGGIMGAAATAVSTEWTKATLGVPGMAYSILLNRSVDWTTYEAILNPAYPDKIDQQIIFGLIQMLWDRGEGSGYIHHLTDDPLPGTPEHQVILEVAFGDHQVANVTAEIMARTVGMEIHDPALADGRHPDAAPYFELPPIQFYPSRSSALFYWDSGTLSPPAGNINPTKSEQYLASCDADSDSAECRDPHEDPRDQPGFWLQKRTFFDSGTIIDPCGETACVSVPEG